MPSVTVAKRSEIPDGGAKRVVVGATEIALFNVEGQIFATSDMCTHALAHLSEGTLMGFEIQCPQHGGRFDVRSGSAKRLPAFKAVKTYPVEITGDDIRINIGETI